MDSDGESLFDPLEIRCNDSYFKWSDTIDSMEAVIMKLDDIKRNQNLVDLIDWEMTPEEAVRLYLEWGNNWTRGNYVIRSKDDVSHYFVVNTWKKEPVIYLIRRSSEEAEELAEITMPRRIKEAYLKENGSLKGVYAVEGDVREWLKQELEAA
jgi:hypothetical protein